jgi:soluble lytic murein transglycosylase
VLAWPARALPQSEPEPLAAPALAGAWHTARTLRPAAAEGTATLVEILALARAELALGRPEAARRAVVRYAADTLSPPFLQLLARAAYDSGDYQTAGTLFLQAAAQARGARSGVFYARAGDAFERAGSRYAALGPYEVAADRLPAISPWLAIRWARVSADPSRALAVLERAPPEAEGLEEEARAAILLTHGDTAAALRALTRAEFAPQAARLALALWDSVGARESVYRALAAGDTAVVREGLALADGGFAPRTQEERIVAVRAHVRLGRRSEALALVQDAVERGDSSAYALRVLGDLQRDAGDFRAAVRAYEASALRGGTHGSMAAYRRARLLPSVGRVAEGYRALAEFAEDHADHPVAPRALYLVAERERRAGRRGADSLYRAVAARWPRTEYAGRARLTLASRALGRRDTALAAQWYEEEVAVAGHQRGAAAYLLARLELAWGDSATALARWERLARRDSLGYYGTMARHAAGLPAPRFAPSEAWRPAPPVRRILEQLDLLRAAAFTTEAEALVAYHVERSRLTGRQQVELAAGLIERGWVSQGVRLGWRAANTLTLNDPQVLRVVFPWPMRELIEAEAREHDLDPYLVAGLIRQESAFVPDATSRAGARGLMQLMPATARWMARRLKLEWDASLLAVPDANMHLGAAHLASLLATYHRVAPALAAYNAGGRPVARWLRYPEARDPFLWVERIPYLETRGYVRSVLRNRELYRVLYPPLEE